MRHRCGLRLTRQRELGRRGLQERAGAGGAFVPVTAVADAAPDPAPTAAAPPAPKPKKAKTARSVKKPSRDQAAPAFLSRKVSRLSSALKPMALRVSVVAEPMWGSRKALESP